MLEVRYQEMLITHKHIKNEYEQFQTLFPIEDADLNKLIYGLMDRKIHKKNAIVRGYYIQKIYEYAKEELKQLGKTIEVTKELDRLFTKQLPFLMECIIIVQYFHNQLLDKKLDTTNSFERHNKLIGGNLFKDLVYDYIDECIPIKYRDRIRKQVRNMYRYVDIGQYVDKNLNHYNFYSQNEAGNYSFSKDIEEFVDLTCMKELIKKVKTIVAQEEKNSYIDLYFKRIYLTSGALFILSVELVHTFLPLTEELRKNLLNFSRCYGVMMQIVNDNIDFIPVSDFMPEGETVSKGAKDVMGDLKNRTITLPLILHLSRCPEKSIIRELLEQEKRIKKSAIRKKQEAILRDIMESCALLDSMKLGRDLASYGRRFLDKKNGHYVYLSDLMDIGRMNKYYKKVPLSDRCV